jgi:hypothetical protein
MGVEQSRIAIEGLGAFATAASSGGPRLRIFDQPLEDQRLAAFGAEMRELPALPA